MDFALKLVSVKLADLGFVLPTLSLVFYSSELDNSRKSSGLMTTTWKSFFFSLFFFALEPIL